MSVGNTRIVGLPLSEGQPDVCNSTFLQQIIDSMTIAFAVKDKDCRTTYINKHFTKLFGYEPEETLSRPVTDILDDENKAVFLEQTEKRKKGLTDPYELSITCNNGQKHPVLVYPTAIYDDNGEYAGSGAFFIDILNQKLRETELLLSQHSLEASLTDQTEKFTNLKHQLDINYRQKIEKDRSLKQTQTRFAHIANCIRDVFWITDLNSQQVLYVSPAYENIWGRSIDDLYRNPRQWIDAIIEQDRQRVCDAFDNLSKTESLDIEYRITHPDGSTRWIRDRGYPVFDENGQPLHLTGIAEDVTDRKEAEFELQEKRLQVQALSSKMAYIEESERKLIADGLHDTIIQPMVFLDIKLGTLAAEQQDIKNIETCRHIRNILGQLIDRTRAFTFDLSNPILYELGLETALEEWISTEIEAKNYLPVVLKTEGDTTNIPEKISIFIFKAVKELTINIIKHAKAKSAFVSVIRKDNSIELCVKDNGTGFDAGRIPQEHTDKKGLGLFSLREKLIHLKGSMDIQSSRQSGTTVTINIPIEDSYENDGQQTK